jgi:coenzyme F420-dependent glucose-6-phosphate dehydrogenase
MVFWIVFLITVSDLRHKAELIKSYPIRSSGIKVIAQMRSKSSYPPRIYSPKNSQNLSYCIQTLCHDRDNMARKSNGTVGYWESQEQYSMHDLITFVSEAERGGFKTCLTSDHFHPWWHNNGYGNFTWVWLAGAAAKTKRIEFVTGVTAAVYRYNPAIIAQAFASLDVLYPNRIGLGIGTGEAMNEVPAGFDWPSSNTRLARTTEAIQIIRKLWNESKKAKKTATNGDGDSDGFVNFNGQYFKIKGAKLYTPPVSDKISLYIAASGEEAIQTAAKYGDGLITTVKPDKSKETFDLFAKAAKEQGKAPDSLERIAKPKESYSEDYDKAFKSTEFWRASLIEDVFDLNISDPGSWNERQKLRYRMTK